MILSAFFDALGQLGDPRFRRVIGLGVGLALLLLVAITAGVLTAIRLITPDSLTLPLVGEVGGVSTFAAVASIPVMLVLSVFLMVPVASALSGLFLETVADAVEARHYPALPPAQGVPFWPALVDSLRYFGLLVVLNLLGILVFIGTGGAGIVALWAINGWLLSREYFTLVATRRLHPDAANALRRAHGPRIWAAGVLMAIPLSVPVLNLVIPVIGVATFTHLFHRLAR